MLVRQEKLWRSSWLCLDYFYEEIETILDVSLGSALRARSASNLEAMFTTGYAYAGFILGFSNAF